MNKLITMLLLSLFACSCNRNGDKEKAISHQHETPVADSGKNYFPVTEFILGDIQEIRNKGINPVKKENGDSSWVKVENLEKEFSEFLNPVISQTSMIPLFTENSFLDQSTESYTFTYEPRGALPDSISLRQWMVYADPVKNRIRRIYMVKETDSSQFQLTWETGKNCRIIEIKTDGNGPSAVTATREYSWKY